MKLQIHPVCEVLGTIDLDCRGRATGGESGPPRSWLRSLFPPQHESGV